MKIFRRIFLFHVVSFFGAISFFVNADENLFPALQQKASRSRGLLSASVENPPVSKQFSLNLTNDVPLNMDAEVDIEEEDIEEPEVADDEPAEKEDVTAEEKPAFVGPMPAPEPEVTQEPKDLGEQKTEEQELQVQKDVIKQEEEFLLPEQEKKIEQEEEQDEEIVFNFQDADLFNLVYYMETLFDIKFIPDDAVRPLVTGGKDVTGNKITFKTNKPLSKKEAWSLFLTFLDLAGLSVVPQPEPNIYRITATQKALKDALPTYIGIDSELLPDNDTKIRYIYFVKDTPIKTLENVLNGLKSANEFIWTFADMKAIIMTGNSYNIKGLMRIVRELDRVNMPQAMSVLRLHRVDASHVKKLYDDLVRAENKPTTGAARIFGPRKSATALYFPETARMIVEERTNSLILLGTEEDIQKIEDFVVKHVDVDVEAPYSPLHVHQLKYADAAKIADILDKTAGAFGKTQKVGQVGGVRGGDKYLSNMTFTPEPIGNRLVIRGDYEDYLKVKEVIEKLDAPQPQVAIEVLILSVGLTDVKELGAQFRNKPRSADFQKDGLLGRNINFQTSGFRAGGDPSTVVTRDNTTGAKRLLGDLIELVTGASAGNTILTLGNDAYGVWGIFNVLKTISNLQVVSNPFLVTTNKATAMVSLGELRRIKTATIEGTQSVDTFGDEPAKLEVTIRPQINSDGMIVMDLKIDIVEFREDISPALAEETAARTTKLIETKTILADKEVLALGGLIKNKIDDGLNKVPILGDIPLIGWLFKNKKKSENKEDLLVLISARILDPEDPLERDAYTTGHLDDYTETVKRMRNVHNKRDVIDRNFFADKKGDLSRSLDKFLFKRDKKKKKEKKVKRKKKTRIAKAKRKKAESIVVADAAPRRKKKRRRRKKSQPEQTLADRIVVTAKVDDPAGMVVQDRRVRS